ncbi:MAG: hypothetical protein RL494_1115 [Bacteroidota bacterium]
MLFFSVASFSQHKNNDDAIAYYNVQSKLNWETSLDKAAVFSKKAIAIADNVKNQEEASKAHLYYGVVLFYKSDFNLAIQHLEKGVLIAKKAKSLWGEGFGSNILCIVHRKNANYKKAIEYGLQTIEIRKKLKDTANLAGAYQNVSNIYNLIGKPQLAIQYLTNCMDLHVQMKDQEALAQVQGSIAVLYTNLGNYKKAENLLKNAIQVSPKNSLGFADLSINLGALEFSHHKNFTKAEEHYTNALKIYQKIGVDNGIGVAYENLGEVYLKQNKTEKALSYLKQAEKIYTVHNDVSQIAHVQMTIGSFYKQNNQIQLAKTYLESAFAHSKTRELSELENETLYFLYELNKKSGNTSKALTYLEEYSKGKESTHKQLMDSRFSQWEQQLKRLTEEREIEKLKYDKESLKWKMYLAIVISTLLFALMLIFYSKRKKDKILASQQKEILNSEKKIVEIELETKKLKEQELEQELEYKSKQLSTHTLHIMQKNKMIQEVKTQMEDLIDYSNTETKPDLKKINRLLDNNIKADKEWKVFKLYFEELNYDFFNKLKKINSKLTQNDLKICALTKLGFNLKETSSLLNVSSNTVKNSRYKLKLKLGLNKDDSLREFIDTISN